MTKARLLWLGMGVLAGLTLAAVGTRWLTRPYTFRGTQISPSLPAPDFTLTDQRGGAFHLHDQAGQVIVAFFGYSSCTDYCPATLARFKQVRAALGERAERVRFVLITVDPERDTPERLREYLAGFDPSFVGLTGGLAEMEPVWEGYWVFREKQIPDEAAGHSHAEENYVVAHPERIYVVDARGNLRLTYSGEATASDLAQDLQALLQES
jgi:protein SCO1/2